VHFVRGVQQLGQRLADSAGGSDNQVFSSFVLHICNYISSPKQLSPLLVLKTYEESLLAYLYDFLTPHKQVLIEKILLQRTRYITVVLDDVHQSQNTSAVIRTCECFGLQDVHIAERHGHFETNRRVLKGSHKWMTLHRYREKDGQRVGNCLAALKAAGYRLVAAVPRPGARPYRQLPVDGKLALIVGNELGGVSEEALSLSDDWVTIPMFGFTESFNLSATVAILLSHWVPALHHSGLPWQLSEAEKQHIRLQWYLKSVRQGAALEKDFRKRFDQRLSG
jgi:tRNA (guanosine-2'-O-)-methyltransferase